MYSGYPNSSKRRLKGVSSFSSLVRIHISVGYRVFHQMNGKIREWLGCSRRRACYRGGQTSSDEKFSRCLKRKRQRWGGELYPATDSQCRYSRGGRKRLIGVVAGLSLIITVTTNRSSGLSFEVLLLIS